MSKIGNTIYTRNLYNLFYIYIYKSGNEIAITGEVRAPKGKLDKTHVDTRHIMYAQ